jgi:hypothetical protein
MNTIPTLLTLALFAGTTAANLGATELNAVSANPEKSPAAPGRPVVHLGMSRAEITKAIGRPEKQETIKTPAGVGEQWIYRRLQQEWTDQTAATVDMVPAFVGLSQQHQGTGTTAMPVTHMIRVSVYQVSSLLFVDGKLVAAKQWSDKEVHPEN